jgi:hypothetical protein
MTKIDYIRVIQNRLFTVFGLLEMHPNISTDIRDLQRCAELLNEIRMLLEGDTDDEV